MTKYVDTLIIGAGVSGLSLSALYAKEGRDFVTLEGHSLPGGCASFFKKEGMSFDVGATTLSGMAFNGPLKRFIKKVDLRTDLLKIDPGLIIHFRGRNLKRFSDLNKWIGEQQKYFPSVDIEPLWNEISQYNEKCWSVVDDAKFYPPRGVRDLYSLASRNTFTKLSLLAPSLKNFDEFFLKNKSIDSDYRRLLDELLLIATQNTTSLTPAILGVLGLSYTMDTWYSFGGMGGFSKGLLKNIRKSKGSVEFNRRVYSISKKGDIFCIKTNKGVYYAKKVVSTLPIWNTLSLCQGLNNSKLSKNVSMNPPRWGALTGYYKIKLKSDGGSLYHQAHLENPLSYSGSHSIFISLSTSDDIERGVKDGHRTLSVSTHIDIEKFQKALSLYSEAELKSLWDREFCSSIQDYFLDDIEDIQNMGIGDPKTFEKYTSRHLGSVGGLPHDMRKSIYRFPSCNTGEKGLYQIGDTTFPGQGVVGVILGAMNFFEKY